MISDQAVKGTQVSPRLVPWLSNHVNLGLTLAIDRNSLP